MDAASIGLILNALLAVLSKSPELAALFDKARSEGRDISDEEFAAIDARDDAAREKLVEEIKKARELEKGDVE